MIAYYDYWAYLGHNYSECHYNKKIKNVYINIPKNASTSIREAIQNTDFGGKNYLQDKDTLEIESFTVVLRDPVERWISGITTYLNLYVIKNQDIDAFISDIKNNKWFLDLLFCKVAFDDHTEKQTYFLKPFDLTNCYYIYMDDLFEFRFTQLYLGEGLKIKFSQQPINSRKHDPVHRFFSEFLQNAKNMEYKNKLIEFYKDDYDYIKNTKFYGR